jgi:hypothetical protein
MHAPGTNEHPPVELSPDSGLIFLNHANNTIRLILPSILLRCLDSFQLQRIYVNTLPQPIHSINRETVVPDEQITHGYV